ncbi:MAG: response regulator transcription factor [Gemmatimonadaceae bacterium]
MMELVAEGTLASSKVLADASAPLTVLLVEDHRVLRDGLVSVLSAQSDIVVVGTAGDLESCVPAAIERRPQIMLMGASLAGQSQERRARLSTVRAAAPGVRVVVMDVSAESEDVVPFVEAGASGFIMKDATVEQLLATIRSVGVGDKVLPGALAATVFDHLARHVVDRPESVAGPAVRLTSREREVVGLVAQGLSNKEIAGRMNLTTYTIKSHVHNVLEKLALHSRLELAAHAHEWRRRSERA